MFDLHRLETPAALVDLDRLNRNLDRAASYAAAHKLALRPHVKTHKSPWIAAEQMRRGAVGVTCATPREAEVMTAVSKDILVAYPPVGEPRASRLAALDPAARVTVALDSTEAADQMQQAASRAGRTIGVYVEVDLGMHRVGVQDAKAAIAVAQHVRRLPALSYEGIAFYPGHVREPVGEQPRALSALSTALEKVILAMTQADVAPRAVSGGSTPTMWQTHLIRGVTEFRPGTYVFNDRTTAEIGACAWDDCALTVLATVISTAVPGQAVIDAGTKSLGREPMRGAEGSGGFGSLLEHPEVTVKGMSEEHGLLDLSRTSWSPRIGDVVRVIPNHVCIVVHLNDTLVGVRGDKVERQWAVTARGRDRAATP